MAGSFKDLAAKAKDKMKSLNDAIYPHEGAISDTPGRLDNFGVGFSRVCLICS